MGTRRLKDLEGLVEVLEDSGISRTLVGPRRLRDLEGLVGDLVGELETLDTGNSLGVDDESWTRHQELFSVVSYSYRESMPVTLLLS